MAGRLGPGGWCADDRLDSLASYKISFLNGCSSSAEIIKLNEVQAMTL